MDTVLTHERVQVSIGLTARAQNEAERAFVPFAAQAAPFEGLWLVVRLQSLSPSYSDRRSAPCAAGAENVSLDASSFAR